MLQELMPAVVAEVSVQGHKLTLLSEWLELLLEHHMLHHQYQFTIFEFIIRVFPIKWIFFILYFY